MKINAEGLNRKSVEKFSHFISIRSFLPVHVIVYNKTHNLYREEWDKKPPRDFGGYFASFMSVGMFEG